MKPFSAILAGFSAIVLLSGKSSHQFTMRHSHEVESPHNQLMRHSHIVIQKDSNRCDGTVGAGNPCVKKGNTCYCFVTKQQAWLKAYDFCRANGMSLLSIDSLAKQEEIREVLPQLTGGVPIVNQIGLWTSGTYVGALNTFLWAGRLTLFSFANWIYGAPTLTAPTECVRVIPTLNYFWADISCEQWLPSICESAGKSGGSDEASPARSSDVSAETVDSVETVDVDIVPGHPEEQIDVEVVSESNVIDLPK